MKKQSFIKKSMAVIMAAVLVASVSSLMSGCSLRKQSFEDTYSSPLRNRATPTDAERMTDFIASVTDSEELSPDTSIESKVELKPSSDESKTQSKAESKTSSKAESKVQSKAESKTPSKVESKTQSKAESKTSSKAESKVQSKTESKTPSKVESKTPSKVESKTPSKVESKTPVESKEEKDKNKNSALYEDILSLIQDSDVVGYTVCNIVGSADEHLVIIYGGEEQEDDTESQNIIILDPEGYAREQAEKEARKNDAREATRLYSIYRIDEERVVPEGDIDGYYTTAYISPNTSTLAIYFLREYDWKFGLVELDNGSAFVNYSNEGSGKNGDPIPPMPGSAISFSSSKDLELIQKFK